jgi:hypothetical protein
MTDQELIEQVSTEVMGWILVKGKTEKVGEYGVTHYISGYWKENDKFKYYECVWNPIINANHWVMIIEKMIKLDFAPELKWKPESNKWCVIMWPGESHDDDKNAIAVYDIEIGKAVCLAALEAVRKSNSYNLKSESL